MHRVWGLAAALAVASGSALAQPTSSTSQATTTEAAAPQTGVPGALPVAATAADAPPTTLHLAANTQVRIALVDEVSSKSRLPGDHFAIRLAAPIIVDGRIVAPAGATGQGEVIDAEKGGGGGKPGKLVLAARYLEVNGAHIKLKALRLGAGGDSEFTQMQVAAQFIGPAVMFMNGQEVDYPAGTRALAKVSEDVTLADGGPAPVSTTATMTATSTASASPASASPASASTASASPTPASAPSTTAGAQQAH